MERRQKKFSIVTTVEDAEDKNDYYTQLKTMNDFTIVYLYSNIDKQSKHTNELLKHLRYILNTTKQFTNVNECFDFISDLVETKVFLIIHNFPHEPLLSVIHELDQLYSVYIFDEYEKNHKKFNDNFKLVKGTYNDIEQICSTIRKDINRFLTNLTSFSIISPNDSLNFGELDQSYMNTQLLKEIIIEIEYDKIKERNEFVHFCLTSTGLDTSPKIVTQFQQNYENKSSIWWYSKQGFLYSLMNRALRTFDVDIILKMGFFIQDVHREIERKYLEQKNNSKIIVYRGQGLSLADFEKLQKSKGGLFSFNNFLSTSLDPDVSRVFAESNSRNRGMVGILFKMEIDPSLSSTPFISLENISDFGEEAEILFSMHTVFQIGDMKKIDDLLWEVCLTLTNDNDLQLKKITDFIRSEISGEDPWIRLLMLMSKLGKFDKAYEIYFGIKQRNLKKDADILKASPYMLETYMNLMLFYKGEYSKALTSFKQLLDNAETLFSRDHLIICTIYINISTIYISSGQFTDAISHCHKALELYLQTDSIDEKILAVVYNNLGAAHIGIGEYSTALSYSEKVLEMQRNSLPSDHPDMAMTLNNISVIHIYMSEYTSARSNIEKALQIQLRYLPPEHPNTSRIYHNVGAMYIQMKDYANALYYHEKALNIQKKHFPSEHPLFHEIYYGISFIHYCKEDYTNALSYAKLALENQQKRLLSDHQNLIPSHNLIGKIYESLGEYSNALYHHEMAVKICQKSLSTNDPTMVITYNHIGAVHRLLDNYSVALSYHEKALELLDNFLPSDHPNLVNTHISIGMVHHSTGQYSTALFHYNKALEICEKSFSKDQLEVANLYNCIGVAHRSLGDYHIALSNHKKALAIQEKHLPSHHPALVSTHNFILLIDTLCLDVSSMSFNITKIVEAEQKQFLSNQPIQTNNRSGTNNRLKNYSELCPKFNELIQNIEKCNSCSSSNSNTKEEDIIDIGKFGDIFNDYCTNVQRISKSSEACYSFSSDSHTKSTDEIGMNEAMFTAMSHFKNAFNQLQSTSSHNNQKTSSALSRCIEQISLGINPIIKAVENQQQFLPPNDVTLSTYCNNFGEMLFQINAYSHALPLFEKALINLLSCTLINQQLLARTYNNMAIALEGLHQYREALDHIQQALKIARSNFGSNHPLTQTYLARFQQLQQRL